jgi:cell division ATPase FtsA
MTADPDRVAVDLGTTWTAAALTNGSGVNLATLGEHHSSMPSVIARSNGEWVAGSAAARLLATDPSCGAREVKRRFGDTTPLIVDGEPFGAERLQAEMLKCVCATAKVPAGAILTLTHPANWGPYKVDLVREVARLAGYGTVDLLTEPEAAALHFASGGRLSIGDRVAVYDLGGGTFDAAVVELTADGPQLLGTPEGLERFGGIDVDQLVFNHVAVALDGALAELDTADPDVRRAVQQLRADCTAAKEALSADSETTVAVTVPGLNTQVRMTRAELESALRSRLDDTLAALDRTVASADLSYADLAGVVLVGGSSRIPLVTEQVGAHSGRLSLFDAEPKLVVALGAASASAVVTPIVAAAAVGASLSHDQPKKEPTVSDVDTSTDAAVASAAGPGPDTATESTAAKAPAPTGAKAPAAPLPAVPKKSKTLSRAQTIAAGAAAAAAAVAAVGMVFGDDVVNALSGDDPAPMVPVVGGGDGNEHRGEQGMDAFEHLAAGSVGGTATMAGAPGAPAVTLPVEPPAFGAQDLQAAQAFAPSAGGGFGGGDAGGGAGGGGSTVGQPQQHQQPQQRQQSQQHEQSRQHQQSQASAAHPDVAPPDALQGFDAARATLLDRVANLAAPDGTDPADTQALRDQLTQMIDHFQPQPGQTTEAALADLRGDFQQHVHDFTQDQKIAAIVAEERRDNDGNDATTPVAADTPLVNPSALLPDAVTGAGDDTGLVAGIPATVVGPGADEVAGIPATAADDGTTAAVPVTSSPFTDDFDALTSVAQGTTLTDTNATDSPVAAAVNDGAAVDAVGTVGSSDVAVATTAEDPAVSVVGTVGGAEDTIDTPAAAPTDTSDATDTLGTGAIHFAVMPDDATATSTDNGFGSHEADADAPVAPVHASADSGGIFADALGGQSIESLGEQQAVATIDIAPAPALDLPTFDPGASHDDGGASPTPGDSDDD